MGRMTVIALFGRSGGKQWRKVILTVLPHVAQWMREKVSLVPTSVVYVVPGITRHGTA